MIRTGSSAEIQDLLLPASPEAEEALFRRANEVRIASVGDEIHLRGLVELSSHCRCRCLYCGLRAGDALPGRYRMTPAEMLRAAATAKRLGYGTVVLQSGEDDGLDLEGLARVVRIIKAELGLAVTLSLGELAEADYIRLREAGADRYLLKHETSNPDLYRRLRPGRELRDRIARLRLLRALGFQIGGGCMVGLPGQTVDDLVGDLLLLRELDVDMAGVGPFIPAPGTPLGDDPGTWPAGDRVRFTYRMMAALRLVCERAMIPVTTALQTLDPAGARLGLERGANVIMPNVGELGHRERYVIYPGKAGSRTPSDERHESLLALIRELGRKPGRGPGHSRRPAGEAQTHVPA